MNLVSHRTVVLLIQGMVLALVCSAAAAQEPQLSQINAPPPIKAISKQERDQIERSSDSKQRIRRTIELAAAHLLLAEKHTSEQRYEAASAEIGIYHALIENALTFLASLKRDSNRTRDLYKRLELALREDGPRLTAMRRTTPIEFAVWIKEVEDFARESRTEALNSFYGNTVVHEPQKPDQENRLDKPREESSPKSRTP